MVQKGCQLFENILPKSHEISVRIVFPRQELNREYIPTVIAIDMVIDAKVMLVSEKTESAFTVITVRIAAKK